VTRVVLRHLAVALVAAAVAFLLFFRASRASFFGEENILLGQILAESIKETQELRSLARAAGDTADTVGNLLDIYGRVNAGVDELSHYSVDAFLHDFKGDIYHLYPELAKVENAGTKLRGWDRTHTSSPFTAYEAISALAGDLTQPLRKDIQSGKRSIDKELILQTEAAGGFALADAAETSTQTYDREIDRLRKEYERKADPGTAAMIVAHTNLLLAEQNSHIIRLLARTVRLDGVDKSMRAADRLGGLNDAYRRAEGTDALASDALKPPRMMQFAPPE
jgi:hypothetical protein